jgi:hypothetical protein
MISSVRPSLKYSLSGSELKFSNGRTTIDFSSPLAAAGWDPETRRIRELRRQRLDRDLASEIGIVGLPDFAHPPLPIAERIS